MLLNIKAPPRGEVEIPETIKVQEVKKLLKSCMEDIMKKREAQKIKNILKILIGIAFEKKNL